MQPLLRIQTVPIEISYSTKRAQLRMSNSQPRAEATRERGTSEIRNQLPKVKMDHTEMWASVGHKKATRLNKETAATGRNAAVEAARTFTQEGSFIRKSLPNKQRNAIADLAMSRIQTNHETIMSFTPSARPDMWVEEGSVTFDYVPDQVRYDWQVSIKPETEFERGGVEFTVNQHPEVIIEYLGGPVYVPPSSDPHIDLD